MKNFDQPLRSDPTPRGYDLNKLGCILPEDASTHIYIYDINHGFPVIEKN